MFVYLVVGLVKGKLFPIPIVVYILWINCGYHLDVCVLHLNIFLLFFLVSRGLFLLLILSTSA